MEESYLVGGQERVQQTTFPIHYLKNCPGQWGRQARGFGRDESYLAAAFAIQCLEFTVDLSTDNYSDVRKFERFREYRVIFIFG